MLDYAGLRDAVREATRWLQQQQVSVMALVLDNTPAWVVWDLAALAAGITHVPIPAFFSAAQKQHALQDAAVELVLTDQPEAIHTWLAAAVPENEYTLAAFKVSVFRLQPVKRRIDPGIAKITYTSGTTGQPKGVCLSAPAMLQVASSVLQATQLPPGHRHFCVLPLATLLENVAGVYATLLAGGCVVVLPSVKVGFTGSRFDITRLHQGLQQSRAHTAILLPELLRALVLALQQGLPQLTDLRFLAVGGAKVAPALLAEAAECALPVYEGYGLSECASVVTLNQPGAHRLGSIGKPLPHMQLKLAQDGELWLRGNTFLGYTSADGTCQSIEPDGEGFIPSGDLARVDDDGYWSLIGRKKNMFITSFGRNVSPEWVESTLCHGAVIMQACVFGEARPYNVAVIVAATHASETQVAEAVARSNAVLPDYAQIGRWVLASHPFSLQNGQVTANGRIKRDAIWEFFHVQLQALYLEKT